MAKKRNFAFIVELFLLFIILLFVIVVITKTFVTSRNQSLYARHLTEAVYVAEEVAEVSMSAGSLSETAALLESLDRTESVSLNGQQVEATIDFDMKNNRRDRYRVILEQTGDPWEQGIYTDGKIQVFFEEEKEPIYLLETGIYQKQEGL